MYLGQGKVGHDNDNNDHTNRNARRRRIILVPANSSLTNMILTRTTKVTIKTLMYENLDANVNTNKTHIDMKILMVARIQPNQNQVTCYQICNHQKQLLSICMIICLFLSFTYKPNNPRLKYNIITHDRNMRNFYPNLVLYENLVTKIG